MTKPTKATHSNAMTSQDRQAKAIQQAKEHLKRQGIAYPEYDDKLSQHENYGRLLAYSEQEAALVVQYMKEPSGPRPLALDTTQPQKERWNGYRD